MSTALISGLVLCGPAANAEAALDEVISNQAESSTTTVIPTQSVVATDVPEPPVEEVVESEAVVVPF